jgi:four helix bundle protein
MQTYKDLIVWQKSIELTKIIYSITQDFPSEEKFGLTNQIRRCCVSIPSNIAEGFAREGKKENANFVNIAYGSATELETQLLIAKELQFLEDIHFESTQNLLTEILKLLYNYRAYLRK